MKYMLGSRIFIYLIFLSFLFLIKKKYFVFGLIYAIWNLRNSLADLYPCDFLQKFSQLAVVLENRKYTFTCHKARFSASQNE